MVGNSLTAQGSNPAPNIMAQKKTGIQCLAKFPAKVQEEILRIVSERKSAENLFFWLTELYEGQADLLSGAFVWAETEQGQEYWSAVYAKTRD